MSSQSLICKKETAQAIISRHKQTKSCLNLMNQ